MPSKLWITYCIIMIISDDVCCYGASFFIASIRRRGFLLVDGAAEARAALPVAGRWARLNRVVGCQPRIRSRPRCFWGQSVVGIPCLDRSCRLDRA